MNGRATFGAIALIALPATLTFLAIDARARRDEKNAEVSTVVAVAKRLPSTDLALSGGARWLRTPSLEEPGAAFFGRARAARSRSGGRRRVTAARGVDRRSQHRERGRNTMKRFFRCSRTRSVRSRGVAANRFALAAGLALAVALVSAVLFLTDALRADADRARDAVPDLVVEKSSPGALRPCA